MDASGDVLTDGGGGGTSPDAGPDGCRGAEVCGNGLDDDCDGSVDEGCGCEIGATQRCYDGPPARAGVGACRRGEQACVSGGGEFGAWGACEGSTPPGEELCEGTADEDCDGVIDEGCGCTPGDVRPCYTAAAETEGVGTCVGGTQECVAMGGTADWGRCTGEVTPRPELCDGLDYDCDGVANTGCECVVGTVRGCYTGPVGTVGVGICREGAQTCEPGPGGVGAMWGACLGEVLPEADRCDGIDYTCTGVPGAGCACILGTSRPCYGGPPATRGVGLCRDGTNTCVAGAGGAEWSGSCDGERLPVTEVCDNAADDDCDGAVDEGCGGTITCPGDTTVPAGQSVTLTAVGVGIASYSWSIVSAPAGGASTARWSPSPPNTATVSFTPTIVGDYVIEVRGTDAAGRVVTCRFTVRALPHGLRVELSWNGTGDVDLHMHNPTTQPWFRAPEDCYYANRTPAWGAVLDFDNTSANGPENIRMDSPALNVDYTIAVHNYARAAGRVATVNVFCGSTTSTIPTQTFTSRALAGTSAGNCTNNDFWTVARVRFTSASTCTITPINTYRTSSSACSSF
ncbi:MAG: hypothetical protein KF729_27880 [Sandaracinaceae bacterium]|nr:hypothetical protein [Sandaracinaceae bacterium]